MPDTAAANQTVVAYIEGLKAEFPQPADSGATRYLCLPSLTLSYAFRTHPPERLRKIRRRHGAAESP